VSARQEFDPAAAVALMIRDMRDPTDAQLKAILAALGARLADMERSGLYTGMGSLICLIDDAHDAADEIEALA
jgi:hypothetical protein